MAKACCEKMTEGSSFYQEVVTLAVSGALILVLLLPSN